MEMESQTPRRITDVNEVTEMMRIVADSKTKEEADELVDYHLKRAEKLEKNGEPKIARQERTWALAFDKRFHR